MSRLPRRALAGAMAGMVLAAVPAVTEARRGTLEDYPTIRDDTRDGGHGHAGIKRRLDSLEAIVEAQHAEMATFRRLLRELKGWE